MVNHPNRRRTQKTKNERKRIALDALVDQRIVAAWTAIEDAEPDISTERLMAMVENDTGEDCSRQIEALERAGLLE